MSGWSGKAGTRKKNSRLQEAAEKRTNEEEDNTHEVGERQPNRSGTEEETGREEDDRPAKRPTQAEARN